VIVGSNLFNLAALLGLPILLVGWVAVQRYGLLINGGAMVLTTALASLLVLGVLPAAGANALVLVVLAGYATLLAIPSRQVLKHAPAIFSRMSLVPGDSEEEERAREREADIEHGFPSGGRLLAQGVVATAVVIAGCGVLVNAALYLGPRAGVPESLTGTIGLAALTSLPNVWVAVSLARRQRGAVLMSAVCNSNTINAVFGICLPALIVGLQPQPIVRYLDIPALAVMTLLAVGLVWQGHGLGRKGAMVLVLAYTAFAVTRLALAH
jgi:Ca2+/Na+ antiporter